MTAISKLSPEKDTSYKSRNTSKPEQNPEKTTNITKTTNLDFFQSSGVRFRAVNTTNPPQYEAISTGIEDVEFYHTSSTESDSPPNCLLEDEILNHPALSDEILRCQLLPSRLAVWIHSSTGIRLSALAAEVLRSEDKIKVSDLRSYNASDNITDPISGLASVTYASRGRIASINNNSLRSENNDTDSFIRDKGVGRIMTVAIKSPMTFIMALARGFHNAPKLYHDSSVRPELEVIGVKSGLVAASKKFSYGLYDGLTGFVMDPVNGARTEGPVGFVSGLGKGICGVVLKPCAGACAISGYSFLGVYKSIHGMSTKSKGKDTKSMYFATTLEQGKVEAGNISKFTKESILERWIETQGTLMSGR